MGWGTKMLISIVLDFFDAILEVAFDALSWVPVLNVILMLVEVVGTIPWKIFLGVVGIILWGPTGSIQFLELFSSRIPLVGILPMLTIAGIIKRR